MLALDRAGFPFNITDTFQTAQLANQELNTTDRDLRSVCSFKRPLVATNLSSLKFGDKMIFLSGFNAWPNQTATEPFAYGESNLRHYVVTEAAITLMATLGVVSTILIF